MTRAVDLLKNKFGVSQLYKHDVIKDNEVILSVYWHPLTIEEMIGWAAYNEIENDEYKKQQEQAQKASALRGKRR